MTTLPTTPPGRLLTASDFLRLSDVPPAVEWFANLTNRCTRRAYQNAIKDFMVFTGIGKPEEFREVTRAHVIAWRDDLAQRRLSGSTIRHRLAALASLFDYLCDKNAVSHNPVKGVKRPKVDGNEGRTPVLGDHQARKLLDAPDGFTGGFNLAAVVEGRRSDGGAHRARKRGQRRAGVIRRSAAVLVGGSYIAVMDKFW